MSWIACMVAWIEAHPSTSQVLGLLLAALGAIVAAGLAYRGARHQARAAIDAAREQALAAVTAAKNQAEAATAAAQRHVDAMHEMEGQRRLEEVRATAVALYAELLDAATTIRTYENAAKSGLKFYTVPALSIEIYHANASAIGRIPSDTVPDIVAGFKAIMTFNDIVARDTPDPASIGPIAEARRQVMLENISRLISATREAVTKALRAGERHADLPEDLRRRVREILSTGLPERANQ